MTAELIIFLLPLKICKNIPFSELLYLFYIKLTPRNTYIRVANVVLIFAVEISLHIREAYVS